MTVISVSTHQPPQVGEGRTPGDPFLLHCSIVERIVEELYLNKGH